MNNNDILRRIRYIFDFSDSKMITLFEKGQLKVSRAQVSDWLKKEDEETFEMITDHHLAIFLNGLITDRRGKKEGISSPPAENILDNNIIFRKLRIALDLKAEGILSILSLANHHMSKHELSALFRKKGHKHYRDCKDQILRNFLKGVQIKYRDSQ